MRVKRWLQLALCGALMETSAGALPAAGPAGELPLPAWGPYATSDLGICCLINRQLRQQMEFPIVVGQEKREEVYLPAAAGGRPQLRRVALVRRLIGLSPVQAGRDDADPTQGASNRRATLAAADNAGILLRMEAPFDPAPFSPGDRPEGTANEREDTHWPAARVTVDYVPAYAGDTGQGLIVRLSLSNSSASAERFFVDLLGGPEPQTAEFNRTGFSEGADPSLGTLTLSHSGCQAVFALAATPIPYPLRFYQASNAYFGPDGWEEAVDERGVALPPGCTPADAASQPATGPRWGLMRLDGIRVEPRSSVTIFLAIGVGADAGAAEDTAGLLLARAPDTHSDGKPAPGLYSQALATVRLAGKDWTSPSAARALLQALANVPLVSNSRLGVATRTDLASGPPHAAAAAMALAYSAIEPSLAQAQIACCLPALARSGADSLRELAVASMMTWELWQTTQDRDLVQPLYQALQAALSGQPAQPSSASLTLPLMSAGAPGAPHPDVAPPATATGLPAGTGSTALAYRSVAQRVLYGLAVSLERPDAEIAERHAQARSAASACASSAPRHGGGLQAVLPLLAGDALPAPGRAAALAALRSMLTAYGIAVPQESEQRVYPLANWLVWKGLLDADEPALAGQVAARSLAAFDACGGRLGAPAEWLDAAGKAHGPDDYAGASGALVDLYQAYHAAGRASTGWSAAILNSRYSSKSGTVQLVCRNLTPGHSPLVLIHMGAPGKPYEIEGAIEKNLNADSAGMIAVRLLPETGVQEVDVQPVGKG